MDRRIFGRASFSALFALIGVSGSRADTPRPKHKIVLQVNANDPALMNMALSNMENIAKYYESTGETVTMDLTAFGPGYVMMRADTSPVKARIASIKQRYPFVTFSACQNARHAIAASEGKATEDIPQLPEAASVTAGVVHIAELQEQGWSYLRP
jgi:uncharacterized protein